MLPSYRMKNYRPKEEVMEASVQFLLDNQSSSGLWGDDGSEHASKNSTLAAICIYALSIEKPRGWKKACGRATEWLIKHQDNSGCWCHFDMRSPDRIIYTTVLVLDAIERANGGKQTTFTLPIRGQLDKEQSGITINASGPIYLKNSDENNNEIYLESLSPEGIKKSIEASEHKLLEDKINLALFIEFQKYESQRRSNLKAKCPTYRKLAEILNKKNITKNTYSPQGIANRVKKLINAGLVTDYYAEKRRNSRERSDNSKYLYDREDQNY